MNVEIEKTYLSQRPQIVVPRYAYGAEFFDPSGGLVGKRAVADCVAHAPERVAVTCLRKDRLEGGKATVDISEDTDPAQCACSLLGRNLKKCPSLLPVDRSS
jgi:hypothetical protein